IVNYGGLKTNAKAQVLETLHGRPIPRLYAAGQTTGGRLGAFYPGPGSALADCFVFGRIAGQNAAAERPWE
ncbi:MAG: FAD-binding protein, partial [Dehalococcoidia bacterium]|nr:FAD-binding protein [Dehalococcoidia bacterium]